MFSSFARVALVVSGAVAVPLAFQAAPPPEVAAASEPAPVVAPLAAVTYQPPVAAAVVDPFRPPSTFAGSGNRGLEYATAQGQPVVASAEGTVVFAGQVGGSNHVTVQHADGLRTSYSHLSGIDVRQGDVVGAQEQVGTASDHFHFGVRVGDTYLDPAELFAASGMVESGTAILIPVEGP